MKEINEKDVNVGCVYLIKLNGTEGIKIGYSSKNDPFKRIKSYSTGAPNGVHIIGYITTPNAKELESELHKTFTEERMSGEWFNISVEDAVWVLTFFKGYKIWDRYFNTILKKWDGYAGLSDGRPKKYNKYNLSILSEKFNERWDEIMN